MNIDLIVIINIVVRCALGFTLIRFAFTFEGIPAYRRGIVLTGGIALSLMGFAYVALLFTPVSRLMFRHLAPIGSFGALIGLVHLTSSYKRLAEGIESVVAENG